MLYSVYLDLRIVVYKFTIFEKTWIPTKNNLGYIFYSDNII